MARRKEQRIKVKIFTPCTRRVRIYSPKSLEKFSRYISLSKDQYQDYLRTFSVIGRAVEELEFGKMVRFYIRPWYLWFWYPLSKGAYKTPVVIIEEELVSFGKVPDLEKVKESLQKVARKKEFLA